MDSNQFVISSIEPQFISKKPLRYWTCKLDSFFDVPQIAPQTLISKRTPWQSCDQSIFVLLPQILARRITGIALHRSAAPLKIWRNRRTTWVKEVMKLRCQSMRAPRTSENPRWSFHPLFAFLVHSWDMGLPRWFDLPELVWHTHTEGRNLKLAILHTSFDVIAWRKAKKGEEQKWHDFIESRKCALSEAKRSIYFERPDKAILRSDEKMRIKRTMMIF